MALGLPPIPTAADLVLARDRLLAAAAPRSAAGHRLTPAALREALADLHEFWLAGHAGRAGIGGRGGGVALFAVGGLGRREPVPYSDLDLVLVHDGRSSVDALAERLWYPLWNSGIGLDHSVRTVGQALEVASGDLRTALGLLDARHLAGDVEITARLASSARDRWRAGARKRLGELVESVRTRWSRAGEVAHWVEPDLKHGRGGLRDIDILRALSLAQLVDRPDADVTAAHALLLDTRTELRRIAKRPRDVLRPQDGDEVATALGLADRFALARALSGAGRAVAYALDVALRSVGADSTPRRVFGVLLRAPNRTPLAEGVVLHGTEVALARDADPGRDAGLLLRVAAASGRTGHPIAPAALARLGETAPEPRAPWPADVRQDLVALLGAGEGLTDVVEALDRAGLWARLFPEWGAVRDLPPRDAAHVWTVDRHLVRTTVNAARLVTSVSRPDLLLLGALLHDIGKGRDQDHSVVGAALAAQVATRLGLPGPDVRTVAAVVRHHLLLPHTATRRDIDDETTIRRVVDTLGGDPVLLELLHALAEADSLATGPGVWTEWKARLVTNLVTHCRTAMAGGPLPQPVPLDDAQRALAESVAATGAPGVLFELTGQSTAESATVTLATADRPGVLSRAAGVLALNSLQVHAATVATHAGIAVGVFAVTPRFGSLPNPTLLREQFTRAISGSLPLAEHLAAKERDYGGRAPDAPAPRVLWFDHEAGGPDPRAVVLELRAPDRIGLLHSVATALESQGVDVRWTRATTLGTAAVDAFGFTPPPTPDWRPQIESQVLTAAR
ncbi:[protein-PII] uridylyltransferase [Actinokineospora globicatena]|uniref:[protein-PII] uridylyltransferase n=1 Tax=Actinokineospora globicatena TaxID=103729 RepID=UPI0020A4884D|nr:[protein-PII] uridylyltransferase [Actinokineospora globicatena]MCP2305581.1 UTP--GlnB (protein PII) uridylyltransferase, GlnD [Actinokineospora globicatena]GLW81451.1 bifunctional uridylyltransferase/uridylyl-removing enzyme [Actinokineospora globicatena]GLW87851.1 bifunctional uridylyltransferase/uridylyl-removing enzyme [Actinokineospora globicatena]